MLKRFKIILIIITIFLITGCRNNLKNINNIEDLVDKKVGIYNGSEYDKYLENSKKIYYNTYSDQISALYDGKIDAFLTDEPLAKEIIKNNKGLKILDKKLSYDSYAFAMNKNNISLKQEIDSVLIEMKKEGVLDKFENKWMNNKNETLEKYSYQYSKTIKFATISSSAPFAYLKDNEIVGYDIDVINYIGYKLNYKIEIIEMSWDGILPAIISGKADIAGCSIIVTKEREKTILFSEPDYTGGIVVITRDGTNHSKSIKKSIKRTILEEKRYLTLIKGFINTVIISIFSILLGTILGIVICLVQRKKKNILFLLSKLYINIIQGIPITLLLLIFYYIVFAKVNINAIIVAIITFSIYFSAYIAEVIRGAIDSLNKKQIESAYAMGFTKLQTIKYIIIPQMLCYLIPVYKNETVSLIKLTSIAGYISIIDITRASDLIRNRTYEAFVPLIVAAILYYIICFIIGKTLDYINLKVNKRKRKEHARNKKYQKAI